MIIKFTKNYLEQIAELNEKISHADAVIIGAGAGLSAAAGPDYEGQRFQEYFADFIERYHFTDMYSAGFYHFPTVEELWAYWSRHIYHNRYEPLCSKVYKNILDYIKGKEYCVITTNVDHLFLRFGFSKRRLFYTQGDYGLWQCSFPCHQHTYDNEDIVMRMVAEQKNMRVPSELVPKCPKCELFMTMNLRCDNTFVQDTGWYKAQARYMEFVQKYQHANVVFWELGVGENTLIIIKYPFGEMVKNNPNSTYANINFGEAYCPPNIQKQSICINADIGTTIHKLCKTM